MKKYTLLSLLALLFCVSGCKTEPDYSDAVYMTGHADFVEREILGRGTVYFRIDCDFHR